MFYVKNVSNFERALRVLAGGVAVWACLYYLRQPWSVVGSAAAVGTVVSGLVGFCPVWEMIGRRPERPCRRP